MHFLAAVWLTDIGRSLREAFFMFWETLWALVLGFGLSGAVQAFVPKESMQRVLGNHGPAAVAKASGFGMVSSSCSYAASAMAKSLFQKGADLVSSMVFMFASTNLVIELGIVMLLLLGWQFTLGEFVGGPIMILLLAFLGGLLLRGPLVEKARKRLEGGGMRATHDHEAMIDVSTTRQAELDLEPWSVKLRSKADWADAASYAVADVTMLRKELAIGFSVAGFLTVLVPNTLWNDLFIHGHGFWTSLENALVGPLIAILSWVCSIGNVPLAAALWRGGISFGGVIAFIFADLIAMPLILIYKKYYGGRLTIRLVALFYLVMAAAGLAVEGIFATGGAIPHRPVGHQIVATHFAWNYTSYLNIVFLAVAAGLYWLYRNRERLGGGLGYAIDPVCGMQVRTADAPARTRHDGEDVYFCSDRCADRFHSDPEAYKARAGAGPARQHAH
ncbi:MAG: permease [Acidimicrobiales bacterium]